MEAWNILLAAPNRADQAVLTGGSWSAPLVNMQTRPLKQVARSTSVDPATTWMDIALDRERSIRALGLVRHNLTLTATLRWQAWRDADHTELLWDSDWIEAWPAIWTTKTRRWTDPNWYSGRPTEENLLTFPRNWQRVIDTVTAKYWRLGLNDPYNPAGWLSIARLVMATGWQPEYNISFAGTMGYEDTTQVTETESGFEVADERPRRRAVAFTLEHLDQAEALTLVLDMQRTLGVWGEVLVCMDPTDTRYLLHNTFWARFRQLQPVTRTDCIRYSAPFDLIEIVR